MADSECRWPLSVKALVMDRERVKSMLPVIVAFADGRIIQFRDLRPGALHSQEWMDINPMTTEFRLMDDTDPQEWRIKPDDFTR